MSRAISSLPDRKPRTKADMVAYLTGHFTYFDHEPFLALPVKLHDLNAWARRLNLEIDDQARENLWDIVCGGADGAATDFYQRMEAVIANASNGYLGARYALPSGWHVSFAGRNGGQMILAHDRRHGPSWADLDFEDMTRDELQHWTDLAWRFDQICGLVVNAAVDVAQRAEIVEDTITVQRTVSRLVLAG